MAIAEKYIVDHKKLRELILYIAVASEGDETFGSTKLNKLLFFSDFLCYMETGSAITWEEYQKLKNGPAPRALLPVSEEMRQGHELELADRRHYGRLQKRPMALRDPDLSVFTAAEIAVVERVLRRFRDKNASEISATSHQFLEWQLAGEGETIPYISSLFYTRDLTRQETEWANDLDLAGAEEMLR
jgi:hypothetical protein